MKSELATRPGVRKAIIVIIAAVLIMSPAFISRTMVNRLPSLPQPEIAIVALAVFLVGMYLLVKFAVKS